MRRLRLERSEFLDLAEELLRRQQGFCFTAHGASMVPCLQDGDSITVRSLPVGGPLPGLVVLYRTDDRRPVVHRVVARGGAGEQEFVVLRGDAATGPGERVAREQVLGHVVSVTRKRRPFARGRRLLRSVWDRLVNAPDRS
jgi:hypothetical protein